MTKDSQVSLDNLSAWNEKTIASAEDWATDDDPANAHNWLRAKKILPTFVPAGIAFVCSFALSDISPALNHIADEFHVSREAALVAYSIYSLGLGLGSVFATPASEELGRKGVYLFCIPIFALFILGTGFSNNTASLIVTRFFAGLFGSPALSIGVGTISDIWLPSESAVPTALYATMPFLSL